MNIYDLNDWQRPAYECVLQLGACECGPNRQPQLDCFPIRGRAVACPTRDLGLSFAASSAPRLER